MSSSANLRFRQADWHKDKATLKNIRQAVFIEEQGVSQEEEWDGKDADAWHFCVEICARQKHSTVACARIIEEYWQGRAALHIGRVAVLTPWRGRGIGHFLMVVAAVLVFAGQPRRPFGFFTRTDKCYRILSALRLSLHGKTFMDAGIAHRTMVFHAKAHHFAKGDKGHGQKVSG